MGKLLPFEPKWREREHAKRVKAFLARIAVEREAKRVQAAEAEAKRGNEA